MTEFFSRELNIDGSGKYYPPEHLCTHGAVLICEMLWKLATNPAGTYLSKVKNGHPGTVLMPTLLDLCIAGLYVFIAYSEHIWSIYQRWLLILSWRRSLSYRNEGPCHIETSSLICFANQWTGFCMIGTSVMKELIRLYTLIPSIPTFIRRWLWHQTSWRDRRLWVSYSNKTCITNRKWKL